MDFGMSIGMGYNQEMVNWSIDIDFTQLINKIPYAHKCFLIGSRGNVGTKLNM
jgi:hypothetical protein